MKKIFALGFGLVLMTFVPTNVFAACVNGQEWNPNTFQWETCVGGSSSSGSSGTGLSGGAEDVSHLVSFLGALLNVAARLILGAAVVFFLWGVFQFVKSAGDEEARQIGKNHIIYGVIGIAVIVSVWGLVNFVTGSIGLDTTTVQSVPKLLPMPN